MTTAVLGWLFGGGSRDGEGDGRLPNDANGALAGRITDPRASSVQPTSPLVAVTEDLTLVDKIRAGDRDAFDTIYRALYAPVWRFIARLTHSPDVASDMVHDIFLSIWMNRATWTPHGSIRAYLFRAARNEAMQWSTRHHARDRAVRMHADTVAPTVLPRADHEIESRDLNHFLRRAVDALPPRQRDAFLLRWNDDMTASEIGRILGISSTAATKLLAKAQDKLEQVIHQALRD